MSFIIGMTARDTEPISLEVFSERLANTLQRHPKATCPTEDPETRKRYANVFLVPGGTLSVTDRKDCGADVMAYAEFSEETNKEGLIQCLRSLAAIADRVSADLYWYLDKIVPGQEELIVDDHLRRRSIRPSRMGCSNGNHD